MQGKGMMCDIYESVGLVFKSHPNLTRNFSGLSPTVLSLGSDLLSHFECLCR